MAHSVIEKSVFGNKRVSIVSCSADAGSGVIVTGLSVVDAFSVGAISMVSAGVVFKKNLGSNSTAIPGTITYNSATTGDGFYLVCYGR